MAQKSQDQLDAEALIEAQARQTEDERARQAIELGENGLRNRMVEDQERSALIGVDLQAGPPANAPAKDLTSQQLQTAPNASNVMYTVPLPYGSIPVGPPIVPHKTKTQVDNMGVTIPPLSSDVDYKTVFLVNGKYVNHDGVPIDQVQVKPALERIVDKDNEIAELKTTIANMNKARSSEV